MLVLASVNIGGDNHLSNVQRFLDAYKPDVVCFQELFEEDIARFTVWYPYTLFVPTTKVLKPNSFRIPPRGNMGVGILSKIPFTSTSHEQYRKHVSLPEIVDGKPNAADRV